MNLSVPTNFDPELIRQIASFPVEEVYGKLAADIVGGGRATGILPNVSMGDIRDHAALCRSHGIRFNYLLNAAATDNVEFTRAGQKALDRLVGRVIDMGVRDFTVATPYLLRYLKARDAGLRVKISVFAQVGDVRKAKQWEDMGADEIVLDSMLVNREFDRLKEIRDGVKLRLRLLVNNNCTYGCSLSAYHMNVLAASSRSDGKTGNLLVDYCYLHCTSLKLRDPANYLIADWIRPEDLIRYEAVGYGDFKLAGRNLPTDTIAMRVKAYTARRYDGNLLDIVQDFGQTRSDKFNPFSRGMGIRGWLRWLRNSAPLNIRSIKRLWSLSQKRGYFATPKLTPPVYVDNRMLDGFLDEIIRMGGCRNRLCERCRFCHRTADRAVRADAAVRTATLADQTPILADIESGRFWRGGSIPANGDSTESDPVSLPRVKIPAHLRQ